MLSGNDADGFSAMALAIFISRSVRRRSPNSAVLKVSIAHFSGCSSPSMSICLAPFLYIASPSSLPENVLTCQEQLTGLGTSQRYDDGFNAVPYWHCGLIEGI